MIALLPTKPLSLIALHVPLLRVALGHAGRELRERVSLLHGHLEAVPLTAPLSVLPEDCDVQAHFRDDMGIYAAFVDRVLVELDIIQPNVEWELHVGNDISIRRRSREIMLRIGCSHSEAGQSYLPLWRNSA